MRESRSLVLRLKVCRIGGDVRDVKGGGSLEFQAAYEEFLHEHMKGSSPERLRKLRDGLGHAESAFLAEVWWPVVGNFRFLHPEYEVADFAGASRFIDFAYVRGGLKLAIEIDGFTTHAKNLDRRQFSYQLRRQNALTLDRWEILRFAHDDVVSHPRRCQQTIQQYLGSRFATDLHGSGDDPRATAIDREIIRLARSLPRPLTPADLIQHLGAERRAAYRHLRRLVDRGWLIRASGTSRVRSYALTDAARAAEF